MDLVTGRSSDLEPCYSCDRTRWHLVASHPFLDASRYKIITVLDCNRVLHKPPVTMAT